MVWTLVVLIILCSSATGSSGWSLPKRINILRKDTQLQLSLNKNLLHDIRGGGDANNSNDEDIKGGGDDNTIDDAKDAMNELRKQWSSIQATPSISYPVTKDNDMFSDQNTLANLDDIRKPNTDEQPIKAIIIVDGFSPYHGEYLSHAARHVYGAAVIHILSDFMTRFLYQVEGQTNHLSSRMPDLDSAEDVEKWMSLLPSNIEFTGIYCESDSGLDDAERLGVALGLYPHCHDGMNKARRDKYLMNQVVGNAGLDAVKQQSSQTLEEAEDFASGLGLSEDSDSPTLVVVKPLRGVASDDVHLCQDLPSLRKAFNKILHSPVFGSSTAAKHEKVLIQEFATGDEYAGKYCFAVSIHVFNMKSW